jgi:hypothetical protein
MGYTVKESCVEYVIDENGSKKPIRGKLQTKYYPPDIAALKAYLEINGDERPLESLSDEELEAERIRLLAELNKSGRQENE